jgi:NADPH2:quinone reductase
MRAWIVAELGEPEAVLQLAEIGEPVPGPGEAVVEVEAVGLNFPDILLCQGKYQERPPLPFTPGLEVAGRRLDTGQRVIAMPVLPRGGLAERTVAHEMGLFPIPDSMSATDAAALHITYQTGHVALHRRAHIKEGETLLVHAAAGGVGSAAVQLGLAAGARVIATAGGPDKVRVARDLGAEIAIDYLVDDFVEAVKEATGGRGADIIYDPVGGDTFDRSRRCVAFEGRILVIGFTGGRIAEAPTNHALIKNYSVVGVHWALYNRVKHEVVLDTHDALVDLYEAGKIKPLVFSEVAFEAAPAALRQLSERATWGKVVVRPPAA